MSDPLFRRPTDAFHLCPDDTQRDRALLDAIFKAGVEARRDGKPLTDNPYAAGSEERDEWTAGWSATVDIEPGDEPNSGYEKN